MIAVIGVTVTLATLTFGGDGSRAMQRQAERLGGLIRLARDEAVITGQPVGLDLYAEGYRFLQRAPREADSPWQSLDTDRVFGEQRVPAHMRLRFNTGDDDASAASGAGSADAIIWPTGRVTPFEVTFDGQRRGSVRGWRLQVSANGKMDIQRTD